jgi:hypothetical protein
MTARRQHRLSARRRLVCVAVGICSAALVLTPGAMARTLGSLAPANTPDGETCTGCQGFESATAADSPSYAVPAGRWLITSWRSRNTTDAPVRARLWVFRPTSTSDRYKLLAQSRKVHIPANSAPKFTTNIAVRHGDILGLLTYDSMVFSYPSPALGDVSSSPDCRPVPLGQAVGTGTSCPLFSGGHGRVNVSVQAHRRRH